MWVNKELFQRILDDNKRQQDVITHRTALWTHAETQASVAGAQKAKDDMTIDWMRHRINALEKERTVLVMKVAGISLPTPEIVATRPGTLSGTPEMHIPASMEDVGDDEAVRLGISHDDDGTLIYKK
jgi:hypothetical protein